MIMVWAADMSASFKISNLESSSSDANGVDSSIEKEQIEISSDLGDSVSLEKSNSETDYLNKSDKSQDLTLGKRPLQGGRRRAQPLNGASENDVLVPFTNNDQSPLRYYHFFKYKELEDLISDAATSLSIKLKFVESGSDQENWFCIVQRM